METRNREMKALLKLSIVAIAGSAFIGQGRTWAGDSTPTVTISGRIMGASDTHAVYVMLWDATGFLKQAARQVQLKPRSDHSYHFTVPPGRWAVSAFEDKNDNGVLDMGFFGPKEPSGFWRPFQGHRKPVFDDVATNVDRNVLDADVTLR
jgi:uncharacterized protein (DUF2141 family)